VPDLPWGIYYGQQRRQLITHRWGWHSLGRQIIDPSCLPGSQHTKDQAVHETAVESPPLAETGNGLSQRVLRGVQIVHGVPQPPGKAVWERRVGAGNLLRHPQLWHLCLQTALRATACGCDTDGGRGGKGRPLRLFAPESEHQRYRMCSARVTFVHYT